MKEGEVVGDGRLLVVGVVVLGKVRCKKEVLPKREDGALNMKRSGY
jgi:hypothetical protein